MLLNGSKFLQPERDGVKAVTAAHERLWLWNDKINYDAWRECYAVHTLLAIQCIGFYWIFLRLAYFVKQNKGFWFLHSAIKYQKTKISYHIGSLAS